MSSKIDERVVQMKFNSGDFAKGVAETSSALDRLKSALNLDGLGKNFQIPSLDEVTGKISGAAGAFQTLQTIGIGVLLAIGAQVVTLGQQIVTNMTNNLVSGAKDGFKEYETQINAIATILGNTKGKGEGIESINTALAELNKYSDKTIYNFTSMVDGIKTLTNQGAGLQQSVDVVKGFANAAALAGVGAEEMSRGMEFGLNQAIAKGYLGVQDFTSIQNVMGEQFKNSLMETARVHGVGVDDIIAKNGSFRDSLSEGWVTSEVLMETLSKFTGELSAEQLKSMGYTDEQIVKIQEMGAAAVAAASTVRTWTQLVGTIAESVGSGWANTWRLVLGDSESAAKVFTKISDEISGMVGASADARNAQFQLWNEMGGRDALVEALSNAFEAFHSIMGPIGDAWKEVFPPTLGKTLTAISFAIRDFTKGLILSENAQKNLKMVATALFSVLKFGVDIVMGVVKVLGFLIGLAFDLGGAIFGLITPVLTFVRSLMPVKEGAEETTSAVQGFFDMLVGAGKFLTGWIITGLKNLGDGFDNFLNDGGAVKRIQTMQEWMGKLINTVEMVYNVFSRGDFTGGGFFEEDSKIVDVLFRIREGIIVVVDAFKDLGKGVADAGTKAQNFWGAISGVVATVWGYIEPIAKEVGAFFDNIMKGLDLDTVMAGVNAGVLVALGVGIGKLVKSFAGAFQEVGNIKKSFVAALDELGGALGRFGQETKADQLIKIAGALIILAGALFIMSQIDPDRLIGAVSAMAVAFGILLGGLAILDKIEAEPSIKASVALSLIAVAVNILASAVAKMGALNPEQLAGGLMGITIALGIMVLAAERLDGMENGIVRSAAGLVIMASALAIVAGVVAIFGAMSWEVLGKGFAGLTASLVLLVGAAVLVSKFAPQMVMSAVGMMAMAAALNMLVGPLLILGVVPWEVLWKGLAVLGIMLGGLVVAAIALNFLAPAMILSAVGIMALAFAVSMLVAPLLLLGVIPWEVLATGLLALAGIMMIIVIAANMMTGALAGAAGMIGMAAAILILSFALQNLAGLGLEGLGIALLGLVAALIVMGVASALLAPIAPAMWAVAGAMAIFGLGVVALSVAMMIGVIAIGMLGPALLMALGGIMAFQAAAKPMMALAGPMAVFGAAMIAFGIGAAVTAIGVLALGIGLIILGAGLALIAAVGILGAVALGKVIEKITGLMFHIPGMLAMGGAFLALGAGVVVLGAGLLVLGAGAILTGVALMMLVPLGALVALSINLIIKSIEKLVPVADQVEIIGTAMKKLGSATEKLADNGRTAASGLTAMGTSFTTLGAGAITAGASISALAAIVPVAIAGMIAAIARGPAAFQAFTLAVIMSMTTMNAGLTAGANQAQATAARLGGMLGGIMIASIAASYGPVYSASVGLGNQMTAGMNQGLQNGSGSVSAMASRVAQNALNAAKRTLDVRSPSRKFAWLGEMSDKGLAKGLLDNAGVIDRAGTEVGNTALNAVRESLSDLKNAVATDMDFNPTIKPVFDMSAIRKGAGELDTILTPPSLKVGDSFAKANALALQQEAQEEALVLAGADGNDPKGGDTYNQYITSPKAVSAAEVYRNTKNLISVKKGESPS